MRTPLTLFMAGLVSSGLLAQEPPSTRPFSLLIGAGVTFGGQKVIWAVDNSDPEQNYLFTAGESLYAKVGGNLELTREFSLQGTLGVHGDTQNNTETLGGSNQFIRYFVEGSCHYRFAEKHRIGLGLRRPFHTKMTSSVPNRDFYAALGSKVGGLVEYEWLHKRGPMGFGVVVRAVYDTYNISGFESGGQHYEWNEKFNGSHIGVGFNIYL